MNRADVEHRRRIVIVVCLAATALCWVLLTPPGAGPDESSHLTRSGGVARGQLSGSDIDIPGLRGFDLPDSYVLPDAACYAQQPTVSVDCAAPPAPSGVTTSLASRAYNYPVWAHAVVGVPSLLPGPAPMWWARAAGAAISVALIGCSIIAIRTRRRPGVGALLLALTPMAWFTFAIVNPSSIATAGAIALWTPLVFRYGRTSASLDWLTATGFAALALPRRDGLIWACLVLAIGLIASDVSFRAWARSTRRAPLAIVAVSTLVVMVWGIRQDSRVSQLSALGPLVIVASELGRSLWHKARTTVARLGCVVGIAVVVVGGVFVVMRTRPGGTDWYLAQQVVGETGNNLIEAIGVLGWLDVVIPWPAVVAWLIALGALVAWSLANGVRATAIASTIVATAIVTSWVFELYNGNDSGTYWQGRYSLPLLVGVPIVVGASVDRRNVVADRFAGWTALAVVNVAAWAAARRFGVGIDGSLAPWSWHTVHQPVAPIVVLAVHAAATGLLGFILLERATSVTPSPARYRRVDDNASIRA